jgi:transposase-like protein
VPIVRLILDGTVVRVRLDKKATCISLLVALDVRADGQRCCWRSRTWAASFDKLRSEAALLDNMVSRGLKTPELVIVDGGSGLDKALAALWPDAPVQRCTAHKHRNLLAHAPVQLHEEVPADYNDMIYAAAPQEIEAKRKVFLRKWRLECKAVADNLEEAGGRLFTFARFPPSEWKSIRKSMEIDPNDERHRASARGIQAPDQDANRAAERRNRRHVVLGLAGVRADRDAKGQWLARSAPRSAGPFRDRGRLACDAPGGERGLAEGGRDRSPGPSRSDVATPLSRTTGRMGGCNR